MKSQLDSQLMSFMEISISTYLIRCGHVNLIRSRAKAKCCFIDRIAIGPFVDQAHDRNRGILWQCFSAFPSFPMLVLVPMSRKIRSGVFILRRMSQ